MTRRQMARGRSGWPRQSRPADGTRPRLGSGSGPGPIPPRGRTAHKTAQLCKQVMETLEQVLAEQSDEILQGLHIVAVEPGPDASQLVVTVAPATGLETLTPLAILEHLHAAAPDLRLEVAAAVSRRRVPALIYRVGEEPLGTE